MTFTFRLSISSAASLLNSSSESVLRDWILLLFSAATFTFRVLISSAASLLDSSSESVFARLAITLDRSSADDLLFVFVLDKISSAADLFL